MNVSSFQNIDTHVDDLPLMSLSFSRKLTRTTGVSRCIDAPSNRDEQNIPLHENGDSAVGLLLGIIGIHNPPVAPFSPERLARKIFMVDKTYLSAEIP
jgi:hypothetical protein